MDEIDKLNLIAGALVLGFIDLGNDEFKCTKEQLCQLCSIFIECINIIANKE